MSATETIPIEALMPWGPPKQISTRNGERILRKAPADEKFWGIWRGNKEALKAAGISCGQKDGVWQVCWWAPLDPVKAAEDKTARELAQEASRATDAAIVIPVPEGCNYLGYQKAGIKFGSECWAKNIGCLIGDEMGLGKTIQGIGLINLHPEIKKVIIICPNTLKLNWKRELSKWLVRPLKIGVQYAGHPWIGDRCDVVIINYDVLGKFPQLQSTQWDLRITDESHYVKNPKAARTKHTLSIPAKFKLALTGTPVENRPVELFPIISDLDPVTWNPKKGFFWFAKRYCNATQSKWGWDFSGNSNEAELQAKLRGSIMVRRLKCDVLTELPPKRRQIIELEANGNAELIESGRKEYEIKENELASLRARVELARASDDRNIYEAAVESLRDGQGALFAEMAKMRHDTGMAKLPQSIAFIEDAVESGKLVVFCHHLDVVNVLKEKFPQAAVITGDVASQDRQAQVDRFQNDPACNIFIGNNAAAEGITLTASAHVVFVEGDWVPGKLAQKEDRTHRIGQKNSVLVSYLVLEGSIDAQLMKTCVDKLNVIDQVLDRAGGYSETVSGEQPKTTVDIDPEIKAERASFERLAKEAAAFPIEKIPLVHDGLKILASMDDDRARDINGRGFNKMDTAFGCALAAQGNLTAKQACSGLKLLRKYRRQLPAELVEALGVGETPE